MAGDTTGDCDCRAGHEFVGVGAGAFILNEKDEILLLKRTKKARNRAGMWMKPGGALEKGEYLNDMLAREMHEELGIEIEVGDFISQTEEIFESQHWIALNFNARMIGGTLENKEPHKHDEIGWFSLDALPEPLAENTRQPIEDLLAKRSA